MTTLSIPITPELERFVEQEIKQGRSPNKAAVVRRALHRLAEEEAVQVVLRAQAEPVLRGDLRGLAKQLRAQ
jgi:putative addiction module CopG family antidote